ncbi:hypothetical protein AMTR_s04444p00006810, partial [Amborella trichopoda]
PNQPPYVVSSKNDLEALRHQPNEISKQQARSPDRERESNCSRALVRAQFPPKKTIAVAVSFLIDLEPIRYHRVSNCVRRETEGIFS